MDFSQPCPSCCSRGLITNQGSFVTRQGGRLDLLGIGTHHIFVFCFSNALNFLLYRKLVQPFHFCLSLGIATFVFRLLNVFMFKIDFVILFENDLIGTSSYKGVLARLTSERWCLSRQKWVRYNLCFN